MTCVLENVESKISNYFFMIRRDKYTKSPSDLHSTSPHPTDQCNGCQQWLLELCLVYWKRYARLQPALLFLLQDSSIFHQWSYCNFLDDQMGGGGKGGVWTVVQLQSLIEKKLLVYQNSINNYVNKLVLFSVGIIYFDIVYYCIQIHNNVL